jgi:hypothetical protein
MTPEKAKEAPTWYQCRGAGQPICGFCQRATPAPDDGNPVEQHEPLRHAVEDFCWDFRLIKGLARWRVRPPWLRRLTPWWP